MQSMKGATMLLGSMNRQMNLPALQRIAMEFERENEVMDERQEMMDDAIDEATGIEGEDEEGEDIVKEVLDEIGVDLGMSVRFPIHTGTEVSCADSSHSWVKHLRTYNKPKLPARPRSRKLLAVVVVVEAVLMQVTMTFKQGWTASDDDNPTSTFLFRILLCSIPGSAVGIDCFFGVSLIFHSWLLFQSISMYCSWKYLALMPKTYLLDLDMTTC